MKTKVGKTTVTKIRVCTFPVRSSSMEWWVLDVLDVNTSDLLTPRCPQMVGCDNKDRLYQWVMSILVPHTPPVAFNSVSSSMWGMSVSEIPRRVVDTARRGQKHVGGRRGKEPRSLMLRLGLFCYLHVVSHRLTDSLGEAKISYYHFTFPRETWLEALSQKPLNVHSVVVQYTGA